MRINRQEVKEIGFILVLLPTIIGLIFFLNTGNAKLKNTVIESSMAGSLTDASFKSNTLDADQTTVKTEKGSFLVWGVVQEFKGTTFRIETRKDKDRFLCVVDTDKCWKLTK